MNAHLVCFWKLLVFLHTFSFPFARCATYSKPFSCFFQLLFPLGQQACGAGNPSAGRSRLSGAFFTHQQDLPWGLQNKVSREVVTASWPSPLGMLLTLAVLIWGCRFLEKHPNPNQACRSEDCLLKAHAQQDLSMEIDGTITGTPGAVTSADYNKRGGQDDSGGAEGHKGKAPPMTAWQAWDSNIMKSSIKTIKCNTKYRTEWWSAVVHFVFHIYK